MYFFSQLFFFFFVTLCFFFQKFHTLVHFQIAVEFIHCGPSMNTSVSESLNPWGNGAITQSTQQELFLIMEVDFSEGTYISGLL